MRNPLRGRRGRRTALVTAGALMAFQALALVGAIPASAVPSATCTTSGGTVTIVATAPGDTLEAEIQQGGSGTAQAGQILVGSGGGAVAPCVPVAIVSTTTAINITGTTGNDIVTIDMFSTATTSPTISWGTINWTIGLGSDTGVDPKDELVIDNSGGDDSIDVTLGASGIDLNTDANLDVTTSGVETTEVLGGPADDTITGAGDTTTGAAYPTKLIVDGGDDDTCTGGATGDSIAGGASDDVLSGGADGGFTIATCTDEDEDAVDYSGASAAVTVNLGTGSATGQGFDTLCVGAEPACAALGSDGDGNSFEDAVGSAQNDTLTGDLSIFGNALTPGAGDDSVVGAPTTGDTGVDYVDYSDSAAAVTVDFDAGTATGNGNDTLSRIEGAFGSDFDDTFVDDITGDNPVFAGGGNDVFDQGDDPTLGDADALDGESGVDTVDYSARTENLTLTLNSSVDPTAGVDPCETGTEAICADGDQGADEADDLQGIENANLGSGDDSFTGSAFNNVVNPGGGQNVLDGLGGSDTLDYSSYTEGVTVNMAGGSTGGDSATTFENVKGSPQADNIVGNELSNSLKSGGGNDNVRGGGGDDLVRGGAGNDLLRAGGGDDDLYGAKGNDTLVGGGGDDFCKGGPGKDKVKGCEFGKA